MDDHPLMRTGIAAMLNREPDIAVVAEAGNGREAIERYRELRPAVTLMDLRMPDLDGIAAITAIVSEFPDARIVALTTYEGDVDIHRALVAGACGYLLKGMVGTEVVSATRAVARGERVIPSAVAHRLAEHTPRVDLTEREQTVLTLVAKGLRDKDIARVIGRTEHTAKVHVKSILAKLGAADRTEAVSIAIARGYLHAE
ncbi:MAG TPA: response regulator transcription factor [Gemmatimonadaceae bacterium]|nr:response regulator transcription factor [Gemmatimonadaceae bacterium]